MAEFSVDLAARVFEGMEKADDEMYLESTELEDQEARLTAAALYKELISDDFLRVVEDGCAWRNSFEQRKSFDKWRSLEKKSSFDRRNSADQDDVDLMYGNLKLSYKSKG